MKNFNQIFYKTFFYFIAISFISFGCFCHHIDNVGHRGCLYEPENSKSAFEKAIDLKVDMIKFDLWECKTGELIVINYERVDSLTNSKGFVKNFTLDELKKMMILGKEKFLTFQEALDCINKRVKVYVEFKEKGIVERVAKVINEYVLNHGWKIEDFIISSFFHNDLIKLFSLCPGIKLAAGFVGELVGYAKFAEDMKIYGIGTISKYLTKEFVDDAHNRNIKMYVYAVDCEKETLQKCITLGVDGILADYPDLLFVELNKYNSKND